MNRIYRNLAVQSIGKNRKLYIPYILSSAVMVMACYLMLYLSRSRQISSMRGAEELGLMFGFGYYIVAIFSCIYIFYTASAVMKKRKKELGLYNVLGMNKGNLAKVVFWETLITAAAVTAAGILTGIVLSKAAELFLARIINGSVSFTMYVDMGALTQTVITAAVIYIIVFMNNIRQVGTATASDLLRSDSQGEKPPKGNIVLSLAGIVLLAGAYWLALSIQSPVEALGWFFVAVIMVIIATYMIFVSGSVMLCRILEKNRRFYYRADHFISVSSMKFRMRRNGAGLASICILLTMVLVTVSSTFCLYKGTGAVLEKMYPKEVQISSYIDPYKVAEDPQWQDSQEKVSDRLRSAISASAEKYGETVENIEEKYLMQTELDYSDGVFSIPEELGYDKNTGNSRIELNILSLEDYNRYTESRVKLGENQVMVFTDSNGKEIFNTAGIKLPGQEQSYEVVDSNGKKEPAKNLENGIREIEHCYIVVSDFEKTVYEFCRAITETENGFSFYMTQWTGADITGSDEVIDKICSDIPENSEGVMAGSCTESMYVQNTAELRQSVYSSYGGFFMLGIITCVIFLISAGTIMYYRQISEGAEDRERFEIMRKVGLGRKMIRKSVDSQMRAVFLFPIGMAGLHLLFAFPFISKIMVIFNISAEVTGNLLAYTTIAVYLIAAVLYIIMYRLTSAAYCSIVGGNIRES